MEAANRWVYGLLDWDAGFDFIDVDSKFQVHRNAGFRVGLGGLGVALLMVALNSEFLLEFFVPNLWRQVDQALARHMRLVRNSYGGVSDELIQHAHHGSERHTRRLNGLARVAAQVATDHE